MKKDIKIEVKKIYKKNTNIIDWKYYYVNGQRVYLTNWLIREAKKQGVIL